MQVRVLPLGFFEIENIAEFVAGKTVGTGVAGVQLGVASFIYVSRKAVTNLPR